MLNNIKNLPIVMISMSRWDGDFSSAAWSLAKAFAHDTKVIYIDYPYTILDVFREWKEPRLQHRKKALLNKGDAHGRIPKESENLYYLTPPAMIPINWLQQGRMYNYLAGINQKRLEKTVAKSLKSLGIDEFILFNSFNPFYFNEKPKYLKPKYFIYQSRDDIAQLDDYLVKHGVGLEIKAMRNSDLNLATSTHLRKLLENRGGAIVDFLPNAADIKLFNKAFSENLEKPLEIRELKGKIVGYTGNICQRLDYDLIKYICENNPSINFVMVGPKNFYSHTDIDLDNIENLHFTGKKDIRELPSYLASFDALLLPFKCNELTKSIYPLKINEYLASGKPVISTNFSEDIMGFSEIIAVQDNIENFNNALNSEIENDSPEMRRQRNAFAMNNSWEQRVELIYELLEEKMK